MNALPVGGERLTDKEFRDRYFADLDRWHFDVAYTAYYAQPLEQVIGDLKEGYIAFAREAHQRGLPACVQIQSTLAHPSTLDISEAQYDHDNRADALDDGRFFASFASEKWKAFLQDLTRLFVEEYGYDWVVFEEPMYRVDIPGPKDRFYAAFQQAYPEHDYPFQRAETAGYLRVQKLKADLLIAFYDDLTAHAKAVGAKMTGIMPWFFIPTTENTPEGTLNTSCDIGRIAALEALDFLIVRMQPDNIYVDVMRTGDDMQKAPQLYYPEVMAHQVGKPVIAVNNPVDEHTNYPELPLIPLAFFQKGLLASMAAAPLGMTRHWYGARYGEDARHMEFMAEVNQYVSRLGSPLSAIGVVFSYRGGRHAEPYTYGTVWRDYWALVRRLLFEEKLPVRTLYADSLARELESHPELRVVVMDELLPLSIGQAQILRQWWQSGDDKAIVIFGGGSGLSADPDSPGERAMAESFGELLRSIGVRQKEDIQVDLAGGEANLIYVTKSVRSSILGPEMKIKTEKLANVERIFGSRSTILYAEKATETPAILKYRLPGMLGFFCGFRLSGETSAAAVRVIKHSLQQVGVEPPSVESSDEGVLWNETRTGYIIVVNTSDTPARASIAHDGNLAWDVVNRAMLPLETQMVDLPPLSFRLFRRVGKRSKLYDISGAAYIETIVDGAGRADVSLYTRSNLSMMVKTAPREVRVDGRLVKHGTIDAGEACEVKIEGLTTGEHDLTVKW